MSERCFKLVWTSQNGKTTLERSKYASVSEATADIPAAEARLHSEFPAAVDSHYPHDIKAGTWRVVPIEPDPNPMSSLKSKSETLRGMQNVERAVIDQVRERRGQITAKNFAWNHGRGSAGSPSRWAVVRKIVTSSVT